MKLDPETRAALWQSIEHWLRNWECPEEASIFSDACALCDMFLTYGGCAGCPVERTAHTRHCKMTPWSSVANAYYDYCRRESLSISFTEAESRYRDATARMYRFLVDLAFNDDEFGHAPEE